MDMMETYYRILKHDPDGRLVKDSGLIPSHSYVIQFLEFLWGMFTGTTKTATNEGGSESNIYTSTSNPYLFCRVDAGAGDDTEGIIVGTNAGPSAEDNADYNLDTKILHSGVGAAGKLNYQAMTVIGGRVVAPNVDLDMTRTFLNETGSTITVKEIGLLTNTTHFLLRDVVADEAVLDGETLTVVYILRTTA